MRKGSFSNTVLRWNWWLIAGGVGGVGGARPPKAVYPVCVFTEESLHTFCKADTSPRDLGLKCMYIWTRVHLEVGRFFKKRRKGQIKRKEKKPHNIDLIVFVPSHAMVAPFLIYTAAREQMWLMIEIN